MFLKIHNAESILAFKATKLIEIDIERNYLPFSQARY